MNFATAYSNTAPKTSFTKASMDVPILYLDRAITYLKNVIVHCDGDITWSGGVLTWSGIIRILFTTAAGNIVQNTIAAGNISLSDNEMAYVELNETNDTVLTVSKTAITTASASPAVAVARLVLGYRNTASDEFYPVALRQKFSVLDPSRYLDGREQAITCADSVTIDWSLGATARMTFDRDTVALTFSGGANGKVFRLLLKQSSGGSDTITWSTTIKWRGGVAPTLSTAGNAIDILTFVYINGGWYGDAALNFA